MGDFSDVRKIEHRTSGTMMAVKVIKNIQLNIYFSLFDLVYYFESD